MISEIPVVPPLSFALSLVNNNMSQQQLTLNNAFDPSSQVLVKPTVGAQESQTTVVLFSGGACYEQDNRRGAKR